MSHITLLHPSRSRIDKSIATTDKWINKAGQIVELVVSVDCDDPQLSKYQRHYTYNAGVKIGDNRSAVDAVNGAAAVAKGNIMIVLSDDTDCPDNWAELIEEEVRGKKDFVLRVEDGIQSWLVTMPVFDRTYYNRFGYVYNPSYRHMFADCEFSHIAFGLNRVIKSNLLFPHLHYSIKKLGIKPDEINHRADRTTTEGRNLYLQRFQKGFDIPGFDVWNFQDIDHERWLKAHGFKRPYR